MSGKKKAFIYRLGIIIFVLVGLPILINQVARANSTRLIQKESGLHGYISFNHEPIPDEYGAGIGFYVAVWPLIDEPLAGFQIGLPSTWIIPDNSDNKSTPLCPEGTLARKWKPRGPTWSSVFQTIEGGVGYWAGNHFRYGPPKFSMNGTPQCYDYEIGSPGWSFFYSDQALPEDRLGIAQLSNRLLIPPDGITFEGDPNGEFLGYTWLALPFTEPEEAQLPTGDQSWTCFLSAANFKGPIAFFIPETWSKIGKLFNYPFLFGRGLDTRPGKAGGGAIEINTVPRFEASDSNGRIYARIPKLQFPVDEQGRSILVQDVTYYSREALYDSFKAWRDQGISCSGQFGKQGAIRPNLVPRQTRYDMAGVKIERIEGEEGFFETMVFAGNLWGLQWQAGSGNSLALFPQYYRYEGEKYVAIMESEVPAETSLTRQKFRLAGPGRPYTSTWVNISPKPKKRHYKSKLPELREGYYPETEIQPGPKAGPFKVTLADGSVVTYYWYKFINQPAFWQYTRFAGREAWSAEKRAKLQAMVENIHASWPIDRDYMAPPTFGQLVKIDPALIVTPPPGLEVGYVPIVVRQEPASR
ncbi:MAG: hypothetical protein ACUVRL_03715 [Candidatus Saccharicenans sp.]|uniref:hypothetical protein n=1 Tax=Candidatus Saccharicenans sp. TaxID=2819258 RepID=UPI00404A8B7E